MIAVDLETVLAEEGEVRLGSLPSVGSGVFLSGSVALKKLASYCAKTERYWNERGTCERLP